MAVGDGLEVDLANGGGVNGWMGEGGFLPQCTLEYKDGLFDISRVGAHGVASENGPFPNESYSRHGA